MRMYSFRKLAVILVVAVLTVLAGACKKKVAPAPPVPTPAPPAAAPTVSLKATPSFITTGQSSTLSWTSQNATSLELTPGIGTVAAEGSTQVSPTESTTYTITATGPGGTASDSARVTVGAPPAPPAAAAPSPSLAELFNQNVRDAFFDFDKSNIRPDARDALSRDAEFLRSHSEINVTIEGHCDERGSIEYNLGLGQRRADAAKEFLVSLGVGAERMKTMSWGKEHPFCTEHNETCWQENRRAHFVMAQ
jgi:peptidoglycan-associated lipoprotein